MNLIYDSLLTIQMLIYWFAVQSNASLATKGSQREKTKYVTLETYLQDKGEEQIKTMNRITDVSTAYYLLRIGWTIHHVLMYKFDVL